MLGTELPCSGSITGFLTRLSSHAKYGAPMLRVYHLELSRSRSWRIRQDGDGADVIEGAPLSLGSTFSLRKTRRAERRIAFVVRSKSM